MAYDPGAIDAALAAAVGDDPVLIADLRTAFRESSIRAVDAFRDARDQGDWCTAAGRLKGLAASFGAVRLMALAEDAARAPARDADTLRKIGRAIARL